MNILLTSVGRRAYIIDYLRDIYKDLGLIGSIVATNSDMNTTAMSVADKAFESPLIYDEEYIPFLLEICKNEKIDILCVFYSKRSVRHKRCMYSLSHHSEKMYLLTC